MDVTNDAQLQKILESEAEKALEKVADDVLEIFKRDYIRGIAYISSPKEYQRTYEFENAWDFTEIRKNLKTLSKELWYDSSKMKTFDPDRFIHGSKYSSPNDIRETLPEILEGIQSSLWISVKRDKKFWQEFISDMISGGKLDAIIMRRFGEHGFVRA